MWDGIERRSCLKVNGNLHRLREMTARLSDTVKAYHNGASVLDAGGRELTVKSIASYPDFGIMTFAAEQGAIHAKHYHPMNEWIGIASGQAVVHFKDRDVVINRHEVLLIPKGEPHTVEYVEETAGWVVTMPKDEGF